MKHRHRPQLARQTRREVEPEIESVVVIGRQLLAENVVRRVLPLFEGGASFAQVLFSYDSHTGIVQPANDYDGTLQTM